MRIATLLLHDREVAGIVTESGVAPLVVLRDALGRKAPDTLSGLLRENALDPLRTWYEEGGRRILRNRPDLIVPFERVVYRPLLRDPGRILGIGLNYRDHAADLNETVPYGIPGSFMKPRTALIGQGDRILIPRASERTTAEGELALVFGRRTGPSDPLGDGKGWLDVVAGFTTVLDMTAEDILRRNPRYLTLSKGFDTFLSLGPHLITPDEIDDVNALEVATVKNGDIVARNRVDRMTFSPERLVRYHTEIMTWEPGDILSTGTPGATPIAHGDRVECLVSGLEPLVNEVEDLKVTDPRGTG